MATTKKNLTDRIAESTGTKQSLVKSVVQQFFDEIIAELAQGNRLEFRDFGVFETKATPARMARNPRTLKKIQVPAKRRVVFKAGRLTRCARSRLFKDSQAAVSSGRRGKSVPGARRDPIPPTLIHKAEGRHQSS